MGKAAFNIFGSVGLVNHHVALLSGLATACFIQVSSFYMHEGGHLKVLEFFFPKSVDMITKKIIQ